MSTSLDELITIKWILVGILIVFTVFFIFASVVLTGVFVVMREVKEIRKSEDFRILGEQYLDKNQIGQLISESKDMLSTHPNHTYANYYLAMAYYQQEKWVDSLKIFEKIRSQKPDWAETVNPYIEKIKEAKPKLV